MGGSDSGSETMQNNDPTALRSVVTERIDLDQVQARSEGSSSVADSEGA